MAISIEYINETRVPLSAYNIDQMLIMAIKVNIIIEIACEEKE